MCSSVGSMKPTEGHRKLFPSISSRLPSMGTHLFQPEAAAVRVRSYIFFSILINGTAATLQEVELKSVIHGSWHRRPIATLSSSGDWTDERPISLTLLQFVLSRKGRIWTWWLQVMRGSYKLIL
ncbi:unnamed protein product [Victoria cruziana]